MKRLPDDPKQLEDSYKVVSMLIPRLRHLALAALILSGGACDSFIAPEKNLSPEAEKYLNDVIAIMQENSMHRNTVDWTKLKSDAFAAARDAQTIRATYPGIRTAIARLGDGHTSYRAIDGTVVSVSNRTCVGSGSGISGTLPANIGYVKVGGFGGTPAQAITFATGIQTNIRNADRADLVGWIVDLRGNTGGNMWPMLAGLGPIVGEGLLGWFIDPAGEETSWEYRAGAALSNKTALTTVASPYTLIKPNPRVAVLVDNAVASSGEATFIAFRQRANTRSFGVATCGLSTANAGFTLSDGATLILTVAVMADRNKTRFGDQIEPDERIAFQDVMFQRVITWLQSPNP